MAVALLVAVGALIYSNSFDVPMQFDDVTHLVVSKDLHDIRDVAKWWNYFPRRPLGFMTLALNYHFSALDVRGYHLVNLAIHVAAACVSYWLVLLTLASPALAGSNVSRHPRTAALLVALLFVAHPIQTQAVTYIVQRLASQATLFYLLAVALHARGRLWQGGHAVRIACFVGAALAGACGMLTKETAFTLPLAIALYEVCFLSHAARGTTRRRWLWLAGIGGAGLLIIPALASFDLSEIFRTIRPEHGDLFTLTPYNYALTQLRVIVLYMGLLVLPIHQNIDHDVQVVSSPFESWTLVALGIIVALLVIAVRNFRSRPLLSFGLLWFFLTLSVESSIIPIDDVMFEHRLYLPMFGFCVVVVSQMMRWGRDLATGTVAAAVLVLGIAAHERNEVWRDPLTLWSNAASLSPNKARPQTNAGKHYLDQNELRLAEQHLKRAVEISPDYALARMNLGAYYRRVGQPSLAEPHLLRATELAPDDPRAHLSLASLYLSQGRADEVEASAARVVALDPTNAMASACLGIAWYLRGDDDRAIELSTRALKLDDRQYEALSNLGRAWRRKGDGKTARRFYMRALEAEPQSTEVMVNLGNLTLAEGDAAGAEQLYKRALAVNPEYVAALHALGVMHYQQRDLTLAKTYFEDASRRDPANAEALNGLGLCYGQEGQLDLAIDFFQRALQIQPAYHDARSNLEAAMRARGG